MPLKHYKWAYDLRGLDSVEAVEAATGLKLPVRILTDEVRGCVAWREHAGSEHATEFPGLHDSNALP